MKWMWWRMNLTRWWWLHNTSPFTFTRCPSCHSTHSASLSSVHCPMLSLTRIFTQTTHTLSRCCPRRLTEVSLRGNLRGWEARTSASPPGKPPGQGCAQGSPSRETTGTGGVRRDLPVPQHTDQHWPPVLSVNCSLAGALNWAASLASCGSRYDGSPPRPSIVRRWRESCCLLSSLSVLPEGRDPVQPPLPVLQAQVSSLPGNLTRKLGPPH